MPSEITVQDGLAPYHFAGMVYNPSKGALNKQAQRLLVIGRYKPNKNEVPKEGLQQVTSLSRIADIYPNSESQIVKMLEAVFEANPMVECYALAITDMDSTKPSWEFTFSKSEENPGKGELVLGICGLDPIIVKYEESEFKSEDGNYHEKTLEILSQRLKEALDANQDLHYDVNLRGATLTLTHKNIVHNSHQLSRGIELKVPGFKVERTAFRRGHISTKSIQQAIDELPEMQFTQIAAEFNSVADLKKINKELEKRWGPTLQMDGHYFTAVSGKVTGIKTTYSNLNELPHVTVLAIGDSQLDPAVWAASLAAVNAKYVSKPYLPYSSLEIPLPLDVPDALPKAEYKLSERNQLLAAGISTHIVESGKAKIDRLVTMHSKDKSYRYLNKKQILSYLRYDFVKFLKTMFPRSGLSRDNTQADGDIVTPKSARDLAIARHNRWKQEKYVQDPDGSFKNLINVRVDENDGEALRFFLPVQLMGQLRRAITTIAFTP